MPDPLWKCYRCDLAFRDEEHAEMHKEISGHAISRIKAMAAGPAQSQITSGNH